jgi:hypothetical protein
LIYSLLQQLGGGSPNEVQENRTPHVLMSS